jgi:hypothetical protein
LSKHLGDKVSLTGSLAHEKTAAMEKGSKVLKMVAATCSEL